MHGDLRGRGGHRERRGGRRGGRRRNFGRRGDNRVLRRRRRRRRGSRPAVAARPFGFRLFLGVLLRGRRRDAACAARPDGVGLLRCRHGSGCNRLRRFSLDAILRSGHSSPDQDGLGRCGHSHVLRRRQGRRDRNRPGIGSHCLRRYLRAVPSERKLDGEVRVRRHKALTHTALTHRAPTHIVRQFLNDLLEGARSRVKPRNRNRGDCLRNRKLRSADKRNGHAPNKAGAKPIAILADSISYRQRLRQIPGACHRTGKILALPHFLLIVFIGRSAHVLSDLSKIFTPARSLHL